MPTSMIKSLRELYAQMDQDKWEVLEGDGWFDIISSKGSWGEQKTIAVDVSKVDAEAIVYLHNNLPALLSNMVEIL